MRMKNDNHGFTLLEAIVALFVVSIICLSFSWLMTISQKINKPEQERTELAWHLFLIQFEQAAEEWRFAEVEANRLFFIDEDDQGKEIIVEQYRHQIKKAKNRGYEPLLINVKEMHVMQTSKGVVLDVIFLDDSYYQAVFSSWQ